MYEFTRHGSADSDAGSESGGVSPPRVSELHSSTLEQPARRAVRAHVVFVTQASRPTLGGGGGGEDTNDGRESIGGHESEGEIAWRLSRGV